MKNTNKDLIIYSRIKFVVRQHKMTLEDLAEKTNISINTIKKWSQGVIPTLEHLITIANYFDISIDYLVGNTDDMDSHKSGKIREIGAFVKMCDYAQREIIRIQENSIEEK